MQSPTPKHSTNHCTFCRIVECRKAYNTTDPEFLNEIKLRNNFWWGLGVRDGGVRFGDLSLGWNFEFEVWCLGKFNTSVCASFTYFPFVPLLSVPSLLVPVLPKITYCYNTIHLAILLKHNMMVTIF